MMKERRANLGRRITSGALAGLLIVTSVINSLGTAVTAYAAERSWKDDPRQSVSYAYESQKEIDFAVEAEEYTSFMPGDEACLNLYIRNNSGQTLTGGVLSWEENALLTEGYFTLISENGVIEQYVASEEPATEVSEEETIEIDGQEVPLSSDIAEASPSNAADPEESAGPGTQADPEAAGAPETSADPDAAGTPGISADPETAGTSEMVSDPDMYDSAEILEKITDITLESGEIYQVSFRATVADVEKMTSGKLNFLFTAMTEEGNEKTATAAYSFTAGGAVAFPVELKNGDDEYSNKLKTNEENALRLSTSVRMMEAEEAPEAVATESEQAAAGTTAGSGAVVGSEEMVVGSGETVGAETNGDSSSVVVTVDVTDADEADGSENGSAVLDETAGSENGSEDETEATEAVGSETDSADETEAVDTEIDSADETDPTEEAVDKATPPNAIDSQDQTEPEESVDEPEITESAGDQTPSAESEAVTGGQTESAGDQTPSTGSEVVVGGQTETAGAESSAQPEAAPVQEIDPEEAMLEQAKNISYKITTYGAELTNVTALYDIDASDAETVFTDVAFHVADGTEPGLYFGTVETYVKTGGKKYTTTQGFHFYVIGDGQLTLKSQAFYGGYIKVAGPVEAFPDAEMLSLVVSEASEETQLQMQEAMEEKAKELGISMDNMRAVDVRILADGELRSLNDDVMVTFENLTVEKSEESEKESLYSAIANKGFQLFRRSDDQENSEETETSGETAVDNETAGKRTTSLWKWENGAINEAEVSDNEDGYATTSISSSENTFAVIDGTMLMSLEDGKYGYVSSINVTKEQTGTEPLDTRENINNYKTSRGFDTSFDDAVIRTFDTVKYTVDVSMLPLGDDSTNVPTGELWLQMELPADITVAEFDLEQLAWLDDGFTIEYFDADGNLLGKGINGKPKYRANATAEANAAGSEAGNYETGKADYSYKSKVTRQVLTGKYSMIPESGKSYVIPGTKSITTGFTVLGAPNNYKIKPVIRCWVGKNKENINNDNDKVENETNGKLGQEELTVTAGGRYNVRIGTSGDLEYAGKFSFDLENGGSKELTGRLTGWALTVELHNYNKPRGLKGIELPQGDITFDITFAEKQDEISEETLGDGWTPILWDYKVNSYAASGNWNRNMKHLIDASKYGRNAPASSIGSENDKLEYNMKAAGAADYQNTCFESGAWSIDESRKTLKSADLTGGTNTYTVTISGYDFDVDNYYFPERNIITTGTDIDSTYIGCFSAGYLEVLFQYPANAKKEESGTLFAEVTNFRANTLSGDSVNSEVTYGDNKQSKQMSVYVAGSLSKYVNVSQLDGGDVTSSYMGTSFWLSTEDAMTYRGDVVGIWGGAYLSPNSSLKIRAFNVLQKFDSNAFAVATPEDEDAPEALKNRVGDLYAKGVKSGKDAQIKGDRMTVLYGVDPKFPQGWNSNIEEQMDRMNSAFEEDLIYYDSISDIPENQKCVAVLIEVRNVEIAPGHYFGVQTPMKVILDSNNQYATDSFCTVNTIRVWASQSKEDFDGKLTHTWKHYVKANQSFAQSKDNIKAKFLYKAPEYVEMGEHPEWNGAAWDVRIQSSTEDGLFNFKYHKADIANGTSKNAIGGNQSGQTMSAIDYKTSISISSDQKTYDLDKGQRNAVYTLSDIKADSVGSHNTSDPNALKADLTINVKVSGNQTIDKGEFKCGDITLSENPEEPTTITLTREIGEDKNKQTVTFTVQVFVKKTSDQTAEIHINGIYWDVLCTNITFQTSIGKPGQKDDVKHLDWINATADITGTVERRVYKPANGNEDTANCQVTKLDATSLYKTIKETRVDVSGDIVYTVTYENISKENYTNDLYLYDILPYVGDGRGTDYVGSYTVKTVELEVEQNSEDGEEWASIGYADSTTYPSMKREEKTDESTGESKIIVTGSDEDKLKTLETKLKDWTTNDEDKMPDNFVEIFGNLKTSIAKTDEIEGGVAKYTLPGPIDTAAIGVYVKSLGPLKKVNVRITIDTERNKAGNVYGNTGRSYLEGGKNDSALVSNKVQAVVVSRSLNGTVWYDLDWDGMRDNDEALIQGVPVYLLKQTDDGYEQYEENLNGDSLASVATDERGRYSFTNLAAGNYVVVFGDSEQANLTSYTKGATAFKATGVNEGSNSDGIAYTAGDPAAEGVTYSYIIRSSGTDAAPGFNWKFDEAKDMTNDTAEYPNLDLGLRKPIKVKVVKAWLDLEGKPYEPDAGTTVTMTLKRKTAGQSEASEIAGYDSAVLSNSNDWTHIWEGLDKRDESGNEYTYSVVESTIPEGHSVQYLNPVKEAAGAKGTVNEEFIWKLTVNNSKDKKVDVTVSKNWVDDNDFDEIRPTEITVILQRRQQDEYYSLNNEWTDIERVGLNQGNEWSYTWNDLLWKFYDTTGKQWWYQYQVVEVTEDQPWSDYYTTVTDNQTKPADASTKMTQTSTITNTHIPEKINRSVLKSWKDEEDRYKKRPGDITVKLMQQKGAAAPIVYGSGQVAEGEKPEGEKTLNADNTWKYEWTGLPKNYFEEVEGKLEKKTYSYSVVETDLGDDSFYALPEYSATQPDAWEGDSDGKYPEDKATASITITNKLNTVKIRVAKWIDNWDVAPDDLLKDEFIVDVTAAGVQFETGLRLLHAGDGEVTSDTAKLVSDKISGYLVIPVKRNGTEVTVKEVSIPKEYKTESVYYTVTNGTNLAPNDGDDSNEQKVLTLYPSDDNKDIVVVVHNTFEHSWYFHADNSVDNDFGVDKKTSTTSSTGSVVTISSSGVPLAAGGNSQGGEKPAETTPIETNGIVAKQVAGTEEQPEDRDPVM